MKDVSRKTSENILPVDVEKWLAWEKWSNVLFPKVVVSWIKVRNFFPNGEFSCLVSMSFTTSKNLALCLKRPQLWKSHITCVTCSMSVSSPHQQVGNAQFPWNASMYAFLEIMFAKFFAKILRNFSAHKSFLSGDLPRLHKFSVGIYCYTKHHGRVDALFWDVRILL